MHDRIECAVCLEIADGQILMYPEEDPMLVRSFDNWSQLNFFIQRLKANGNQAFGPDPETITTNER